MKDLIQRGPVSQREAVELRSEDREKQLEELFREFDSANPAPGIPEEAFHRENWYR
ncbi:MAG: hypothetical protein ABJF23_19105 [Bryobacteraceae bacterium]